MKFPAEDQKVTFVEGIITMSGAGGPALKVRKKCIIKIFRMECQFWYTLAILAWIRKLSILLMVTSLLFHKKELSS
jgi:hypothetical protein